ncbi:MAG: hypothetical protein LBO66_01225 [Deltaproteobacteria bacterium]|jgi:hypothetical protein|nr:hypothetical protein [Deltaproteobacteria bacterium]
MSLFLRLYLLVSLAFLLAVGSLTHWKTPMLDPAWFFGFILCLFSLAWGVWVGSRASLRERGRAGAEGAAGALKAQDGEGGAPEGAGELSFSDAFGAGSPSVDGLFAEGAERDDLAETVGVESAASALGESVAPPEEFATPAPPLEEGPSLEESPSPDQSALAEAEKDGKRREGAEARAAREIIAARPGHDRGDREPGSREGGAARGYVLPLVFMACLLAGNWACYFLLGIHRAYFDLVETYFHPSQWLLLGTMVFFGIVSSKPVLLWREIALVLIALFLALASLIGDFDFYAAKLLVICLLSALFMLRNGWRLKFVLLGGFALYLVGGFWVYQSSAYRLYPFYFWVFNGESELLASYTLVLQRLVFDLANLWGGAPELIGEVDLVQPDRMSLNGVLYLALWGGKVLVFVYVAALLALMAVILHAVCLKLQGLSRSVAVSVWFTLFVNQYLTLFSFFTPSVLMMSAGTHGIPFVGGFEPGLQLIWLVLFVFYPRREPLGL